MSKTIGGIDVSRETFEALAHFSELVQKWTPKINLIAASTVPDIWDRHIVDSAQIYQFAPESYTRWLDIGSGGGFPGIVVAAIGLEKMPAARFELIESDQRKATFLRTAVRELGLHATVTADRIENRPASHADVITARALGALPALLPLLDQHIAPQGLALLHKGRQVDAEIAQARKNWRFDLEEASSLTDPDGRLLLLKRISRVA